MIRIAVAAAAALILAAQPGVAQEERDLSKVQIRTTDLGHDTYMLEGSGGNITVAIAADGVIMVDSEFAPLHDKIRAAIAALTSAPIRYLVDTHYHGDHTGGNAAFARDGVIVVAHANVKKRLADGSVNGQVAKGQPAPSDALPARIYTSAMVLSLKGRTASLHHVANAHTDGDTYVWFKDANVIATGDTLVTGHYPNIDYLNGGNIKGMIDATDAYLRIANDETKFVPGHGPLADKETVVRYRAMLLAARDRMEKLVKAGKTEDEAIAAKPFADYDAKVKATPQQSAHFVSIVYHSLKDK